MSANKKPLATVGELIDALSQFDRAAPIHAVWESTSNAVVDVVQDGETVLLDVDDGWLRERIERDRGTKKV
jgi:hypothetical protein